jgi:hypothetical protein
MTNKTTSGKEKKKMHFRLVGSFAMQQWRHARLNHRTGMAEKTLKAPVMQLKKLTSAFAEP